jgi:hypothetical protein
MVMHLFVMEQPLEAGNGCNKTTTSTLARRPPGKTPSPCRNLNAQIAELETLVAL